MPEGAISLPPLMAFLSMTKTTLKKCLCKWRYSYWSKNSIVKTEEHGEVGGILLATAVTEYLSDLNPY